MIAVDGSTLNFGSANFTGVDLGARDEHRRKLEVGIVTDNEWLLDEMQGTLMQSGPENTADMSTALGMS